MYIDTHCHLDFESFDTDREAVVNRALEAGVSHIIVPALDLENCPTVLALADRYACVYAAVGIHPNETAAWQADWLEPLRAFAQHEKVVAIGEIGLDYYWKKSVKEVQVRAFGQQLGLAAELALPVIVHNREASEDIIKILGDSSLSRRPNPGVLHSFSGDWIIAEKAIGLGFYLGFTGPVTYKKAEELRHIARHIPLDRILIETDAPFLSPQIGKKRPSRNEPAFVTYVAERIAAERQLETAVFAENTTRNSLNLFSGLQPYG